MSISLVKLTSENWQQCADLTLRPEQAAFAPTNLWHIAQSRFFPEWCLYGIAADEAMVGFTIIGRDPQDGTLNLIHLMIDGAHQGRGYGTAALGLLFDRVAAEGGPTTVWLSVHPHNAPAIGLYRRFGFREALTGLESDDEIFLRRNMGGVTAERRP